tara:strand:+ start:10 stop:675 length:666 start_codon:yes stop_codon:yes gene_type:complete
MLGIRFISRWVYRSVVILLVLLIGALLLRDPIIQALTESRISEATGLDVRIRRLNMGLLKTKMTIEGLRVYNTAEFGGGIMLDIPELHFEADASALKDRSLKLKLLRIELAELQIVINRDGISNFEALRRYRLSRQTDSGGPLKDIIDPTLKFVGIDILNLSVEKFHKTDLKRGGPPQVIEVNVKNAVYQQIHTKDELKDVLEPDIVKEAATYLTRAFAIE